MGCIFKRKWKDKTGNIHEWKPWWIKYYRNGKPYVESTHTASESKAKRLLRRREGEIAKGEIPGIYFDKVRFADLAADLLTDYRVNGQKNLSKVETYVKQLAEFFGAEVREIPPEEKDQKKDGRRFEFSGGLRITEITTAKIKEYTGQRMSAGLSNASVNRELAALKRMFHLAAQCTPPKVGQVPFIPMLKESNTRKGFFEHTEFLALRTALPSYLRPIVTFAYYTGWRVGEILGITWEKVDLKNGIVHLDPGETKNEEGRTLYLNGELLKEMQILQANRAPGCRYVFQRGGQQIRRFSKSWSTACRKSGLWAMDEKKDRMAPTKIFHDFRRTAVRNMIRSGIPERVAMTISGHKTRSIFDRYNIVNQEDLKEAAKKQEAYVQNQETVYSLGYSGDEKVFSGDAATA